MTSIDKRLSRLLKIAFCLLMIGVMAGTTDADAARRRKRTGTTTSTSTTSRQTQTSRSSSSSSSSTSRSAKRQQRTATVTEQTQAAARNASKKSSSSSTSASKGGEKKSTLTKITVEKPDLEEVRNSTLDPKNKYYFPKLMEKYQKNDTTMSLDEYRYLYLGYMFQEDYDPYRLSEYSHTADSLRYKEVHTTADIDTIRKYAEKVLMDNPFDLRQMSFLVHFLNERKKFMSAKIWEYRLENLLAAIKSTGTGEDIDNAWYVIYPMHEYDMIQLLGYEAVDVEYIEPGFDYLKVKPDGSVKHRNPAKGFYFNIQVPAQQYELKHPQVDDEEEDDEESDASAYEPDEE